MIKGMEMPKTCKECPFSDHEAWCLIPGDWRERYYMPKDERSKYCPLIELPSHGGKGIEVAAEMDYKEAKAKYEAWKNRNIRVGDEVIYDSRTKAVVVIPETEERYGTILTGDFATIVVSHDDLEKTGRHFDDIAELLKKMGEES